MHDCPECGCACYCGGDIDDSPMLLYGMQPGLKRPVPQWRGNERSDEVDG